MVLLLTWDQRGTSYPALDSTDPLTLERQIGDALAWANGQGNAMLSEQLRSIGPPS